MVQIGLNVAAIVSIPIESILYGISILMFLWTLWALFNDKSTHINKVMLTAAWILFITGTLHLIVDSRRAYLGFIVSEAYFLDNNFNTFKNSVYGAETFVADAVLLYRCYIVWRDFKIILLPMVLWMATIVTGIHAIWSVAQPVSIGEAIFLNETAHWVTAFYSVALTANLTATMLLAYRIWRVNGAVNASSSSSIGTLNNMNPRIRSVLLVIMECGILYSVTLIVMLVLYLSKSNGVYIMFDIIVQIIPITFYVIIIRTSLHRLTDKQKLELYKQYTSNYVHQSSRNIVVRVDEAALAMSDIDSASGVGTDRTPRKSNASLIWSVPSKSFYKTEY
ncbi:hypothetical protein Clacol_000231 [Clathrus columnatus]|uniref:Uncharacterized protein n=1 Tax=Clathrus columnatus TaxID=1419009 RepID=A0AAV5A067_9AGAM|nr:hypothetical protein Clacol_000231 [Clathrus columnatus]